MRTDNVFTVITRDRLINVTHKHIGIVLIVIGIILIVFAASSYLLGSHYKKVSMTNEIKSAIRSNEYRRVEDFFFFKDLKGRAYISTTNLREVADISIAGAGDEGNRQVWDRQVWEGK